MRWHRWPLSPPRPSNHQPPRALVLASDLPQICRRFCNRSSEAAVRSFDTEFFGPEYGLVWALASDLSQICRRFCGRSSEAAIRSFDIEFLGPEFGLVWQRL